MLCLSSTHHISHNNYLDSAIFVNNNSDNKDLLSYYDKTLLISDGNCYWHDRVWHVLHPGDVVLMRLRLMSALVCLCLRLRACVRAFNTVSPFFVFRLARIAFVYKNFRQSVTHYRDLGTSTCQLTDVWISRISPGRTHEMEAHTMR